MLVSMKEDLLRVISCKDEKTSKARSVQSDLSALAAKIRSLESERQDEERKLSEISTKIALQEEAQKAKEKALADIAARKNEVEELCKSTETRLSAFRHKSGSDDEEDLENQEPSRRGRFTEAEGGGTQRPRREDLEPEELGQAL